MRLLRALAPLIASVLSLPSASASSHSDPLNYITPVDNPVIHTPSHRVHSLSTFDLTFALHQDAQRIKLTLEPNHEILADDAQITFLDRDGNVERTQAIRREEHRVFKGTAAVELGGGRWERTGWARIRVIEDGANPLFEGTFAILNDYHHVMLRSKYVRTKHELDPELGATDEEFMVVFRDSDIGDSMKRSLSAGQNCGADELDFNIDPNNPVFNVPREDTSHWGSMSLDSLFGTLTKRQDSGGGRSGNVNLRSTIGQTAGCPRMKKVALVGVAADCSYTDKTGGREAAKENIISMVNEASQIFESTFNIALGLRNVTIENEVCPPSPPNSNPWNIGCGDNQPDLNGRLNLFSGWRAEQQDENAFWTLMTGCPSGSKVGVAWMGALCINDVVSGVYDPTNASSVVTSGANVVFKTRTEWQVFAHEAGHIFGAVHDCDEELCQRGMDESSQCCPFSDDSCNARAQFLMNPSSRDEMRDFSPCTVGNVCSAIGRSGVQSACLVNNRDVPPGITGSQCGNGIVEEGEECDCGGEQTCGDNACCDPKTCKFKSGAQCDDSNEECCDNCRFASADTVCREGTDECDPDETCTGDSSGCPKDIHEPDGQECGKDGFTCASGQCTSRDEQCRMLMGSKLDGNETYACDEQQCNLMCSSPSLHPGTCKGLMQYFLDGTPCAAGGKCYNGDCKGSSFAKEAEAWINNHKPLVIGLSVGIGSLLLISCLACIFRRCRRPRRRKVMPPVPYPGPPPPGLRGAIPMRGMGGRAPPRGGYQWPGQPQPYMNMNSGPPPVPPRGPPPAYPGGGPGGTFRYA